MLLFLQSRRILEISQGRTPARGENDPGLAEKAQPLAGFDMSSPLSPAFLLLRIKRTERTDRWDA